MATTRIIPMHINKGKALAQCLTDRTDYAKSGKKTQNGELISCFACDPHTIDAEFLLSKRQYRTITGKEEVNDVIAYQVRQSFKPGEVTPEEANRIGYEFAERFLKGNHAFMVCTHTDRNHIHNHIIWNSTTLDCTRKFRDFRRSGKAVAKLSDLICAEHQLSVIANPQRHGASYDKWLGNNVKPSHREVLREAIDHALAQKPKNLDALLYLLENGGYTIKRGAYISFAHNDFKRSIRLSSLGEGYTEDDLRAVLLGQKVHTPKRRRAATAVNRPQSVIDIQGKLAEGKGEGYRRWATVENLKRMAKTKLYMDEHGLDYNAMTERKAALVKQERELSAQVTATQTRLAEINVLKTHIINYSKTRSVYEGYRKSEYSKKYLEDHESDIVIHKAAKKAFDELGVKKLPTVKSLQVEFAAKLKEKSERYAELKRIRSELRELAVHTANYEELRDFVDRESIKGKEQGR